ncbi:vitellogenic carboxypeptidase-like [Anticarsia gemmatalis]|uniref:vitellogenic carboxypeptidase-like n=1 Tax=Anticarsia gemmatalis TaxID=129554 RepID=UPI003F768201
MHTEVYFVLLLCAYGFAKVLPQEDRQQGPLLLTPYIQNGKIDEARNLSVVDPTLFAGVPSHSGYFTVDENKKWHLFFWYFPAQGVPLKTTPLIIWLQGGPGCSSLFGLFEEIGPIQLKNGTMERMPISWGSDYSLLFIDNPVGTGFSFTETDEYTTNEDMVGECLLSFIQQFLQVFPELRPAPLFLAGESYAGKYIPAFGHYIHHNKNDSLPINLKGLAIGNGWTDPPTLMHYAEFALQIGLVDPEQAQQIHEIEEKARKLWDENNVSGFKELARKVLPLLQKFAPGVNFYNYIQDGIDDIGGDYLPFLRRPEIQDALHAKRTEYHSCDEIVHAYLWDDMYKTVKPWLEELLEHYGVMSYSGQLDVIVAYALSVNTFQSLKWSGQQDYLKAKRIPIIDKNNTLKINSYIKSSGNFFDVMVRSAGHMAPTDQPTASKQILDMFINKFK